MKKDTMFAGLDVHKSSISIAVADRDGDMRSLGLWRIGLRRWPSW